MAADFESKNLAGFAKWMKAQSAEELNHAMKLFNYVLERGGHVELMAIESLSKHGSRLWRFSKTPMTMKGLSPSPSTAFLK